MEPSLYIEDAIYPHKLSQTLVLDNLKMLLRAYTSAFNLGSPLSSFGLSRYCRLLGPPAGNCAVLGPAAILIAGHDESCSNIPTSGPTRYVPNGLGASLSLPEGVAVVSSQYLVHRSTMTAHRHSHNAFDTRRYAGCLHRYLTQFRARGWLFQNRSTCHIAEKYRRASH